MYDVIWCSMRIALKIGYDGTKFHGFAVQPDVRTIEGDLIKNLQKITGMTDGHKLEFQYASRTDRGVSAAGNVIALTTEIPMKKLVYSLQDTLEDIWITGMTPVNNEFNPRYASMRGYRYFLPAGKCDLDKMRQAAQLFIGKHDYTNYCKLEDKSPLTTITSIQITPHGSFYLIDMTAHYFLWHQVRRIVAALEKVGKHEVDLPDIHASLATPHHPCSFGNAAPEYLVLLDVIYPDIVFTDIVVYQKKLGDLVAHHRARALIFETIHTPPKF